MTWIKVVIAIVIVSAVAYGLFKVYRWYQSRQKSGSKKASHSRNNSKKSSFSIFTDEETAASQKSQSTLEGSGSLGSIFKLGRERTTSEPPKKTFGQKVKGVFGIGKKSDNGK